MKQASILEEIELERLQQFGTPSLANAIEFFRVRPRNEGYMNASIRCILPLAKPMVGYAVTARFVCARPAAAGQEELRYPFWEWMLAQPKPRVVVLQDLDDPPGVGSFWGEVMASTHVSLGCVGTVTNGGVRDLPEVEGLGFAYFASSVLVAHAYVHLVDFGTPVQVGGVTVQPGQLIHADQHGVLLIPHDVAPYLADVAAAHDAVEQEFIHKIKTPGLTLEELRRQREEFQCKRAALGPPATFRSK
jgi:4-hydroxy-4-methyl-2-oxoglutarate aldolase